MSLEQRENMIVGVFKFAYFGHVGVGKGVWTEMERYCETFFSARTATDKTKTDLLNKIVSVIQSDPLTQFPVSKPHKKSTLKWISKVFCSDPIEISNELESDSPEPEFIFKTFDRGGSVFVTLLEENREIIGHGTTGLTSWQGALFLSDWAQNHVNKLKDKRILELGAGVGMLGISLLKTLPIREYILTDCHYKVLDFLRYNLKINFAGNENDEEVNEVAMEKCMSLGPASMFQEHKESRTTHRQQVKYDDNVCDVTIRQLDWLKFDENDFKKVDVILGTDIVYERSFLPPLCNVLTTLLMKSDSENPLAYIACTERSQTTLLCFEKAMEEHCLKFEVIQRGMYAPTDHIICSDVLHQMTKIYQVTLDKGSHRSIL